MGNWCGLKGNRHSFKEESAQFVNARQRVKVRPRLLLCPQRTCVQYKLFVVTGFPPKEPQPRECRIRARQIPDRLSPLWTFWETAGNLLTLKNGSFLSSIFLCLVAFLLDFIRRGCLHQRTGRIPGKKSSPCNNLNVRQSGHP